MLEVDDGGCGADRYGEDGRGPDEKAAHRATGDQGGRDARQWLKEWPWRLGCRCGDQVIDLVAIQHDRLLVVPDVGIRVAERGIIVVYNGSAGRGPELVDLGIEMVLVHKPCVDGSQGGLR